MKKWYNIPVNIMKKYIVTYIDYENGRALNAFALNQACNTKKELSITIN